MKSRRIISSLALAAVTTLALTGCMSFKVDVSVNEDKTANVEFAVAYDKAKMKQLLSYNSENPGSETVDPLEAGDICASIQEEAGTDGGSMGENVVWSETEEDCVATVSVKNISFDESGLSFTKASSDATEGIQLKSIGDSAQFIYDTSSLQESLGSSADSSMVSWDSILTDFDVTVTFAGEVTDVNFDGVISEDKHSVAWNVDSIKAAIEEGGNLEATGGLSSPVNILPFIIGGVLLLVVIGGAAAFFAFRRKGDDSETPVIDDVAPETTANPIV